MDENVLYTLHLEYTAIQIFAVAATTVICVLFGRALIHDVWKKDRRWWRTLIWFLAALLMLWTVCLAPLLDHAALSRAWRTGDARIAEGPVIGYQWERRPNGICQERFTVDGVEFFHEEWGYFPGYFRCGNIFSGKAGVIRGDGQLLRITYVPDWPYEDGAVNAIVQIEK